MADVQSVILPKFQHPQLWATVCLWIIRELMRVSFPQATGCYEFHSIKHHFKPTWITVWLPEDRSIHRSPLQPPQISDYSNLAPLCLSYLTVVYIFRHDFLIKWTLLQVQLIFLAASVFWEPNCAPGRFEMMLDAMKLQVLVIAACSLRKRHP
jgi:hypothetical protein